MATTCGEFCLRSVKLYSRREMVGNMKKYINAGFKMIALKIQPLQQPLRNNSQYNYQSSYTNQNDFEDG